MSPIRRSRVRTLATHATVVAALVAATGDYADEAAIRKNFAERLPDLPKIDEVTKTPIPGLYEVRIGTEVLYADENGNHLIQGSMLDTKSRTNLTEARVNKLSAIDFSTLPLKDAMVWKQGTGARKIAVFADPNCSYCHRFEKDLQAVKNVTVYTFLYPVLGQDSNDKARDIWCTKDAAQTWHSWMLDGVKPPRAMGACDTPVARNVALGKKHRVNGTPALVFEDGTRIPGALNTEQIEKQLVASGAKS